MNLSFSPPSVPPPPPVIAGIPQRSQWLHLINCTAHSQTREAFAAQGKAYPYDAHLISFVNPDSPICQDVVPTRKLETQLLETWRRCLETMDVTLESLDDGFDGVFLGGYAPIIGPLAHFLTNERHRCFVAVQGPSEMVNGKPRGYLVDGIRRIKKVYPAPAPRPKSDGKELFWIGSRFYEEERGSAIKRVWNASITPTTPISPPPMGHEIESYIESIDALAREIAAIPRSGILFDGVATETLCYMVRFAKAYRIPMFFVRTDPSQKTALNVAGIVAVQPFPEF